MNYYKKEGGVIATVGTLDLPEITQEEFEAVQSKAAEAIEAYAPIAEATRLLTQEEILKFDMRSRANSLNIDNATAGRMVDYFPAMAEVCAEGELISAGTRIRDDKDASVIWRANVDIWNTTENSPANAPTLWNRVEYRNGVRLIPDEIPAPLAWKLGELGWRDGHIYRSGMDGNVYPPGTENAPWEKVY